LAMVKVNKPPPGLTHWPINSPDDVYQLDRRAHIWRFSPELGKWECVYISPMVTGRSGDIVARDIGYRGSAVFKGPDDRKPCLYVCTWSSSKGLAPILLRSEDGVHFDELPKPPWGEHVNTFRTLAVYKDRIFSTPTGSTAGYGKAQECVGGAPSIYETRNPVSGEWREVSLPGFGDETNKTIFEIVEFHGYLYAGTVNPVEGFQIWKTDAEGRPPYRWSQVLSHGAYRGVLNEIAVSMVPFKDALYVGTGIINGGFDRHHKVGPAPAEVLRIYPDDTWELLVGNARLSPDGLLVPRSGLGAGFDNFFNGYVWRMAVHDDYLYVGTFKWNTLLPWMPLDRWPKPLADAVHRRGVERILDASGGFDLWRTQTGNTWDSITRTGFGNRYNWGVRNMASTPYGLFVGSANPFGPEVAVRGDTGWAYVENQRGGVEVFLGRKD
jgi:hypothetical protein